MAKSQRGGRSLTKFLASCAQACTCTRALEPDTVVVSDTFEYLPQGWPAQLTCQGAVKLRQVNIIGSKKFEWRIRYPESNVEKLINGGNSLVNMGCCAEHRDYRVGNKYGAVALPRRITCSCAKVTQQCWEADFPGFINAPTSSPDLKPMDFAVWGHLTQQVATKNNANSEALKIFLKKAWDDLDVDYLRAVIDSYPKRL
uniref:Uncharacterized protein n=1 Tax=Caenorhabditis japonica TaxID=281687 RepID=A0A8R1J0R7_CAEJA